MPLVTVANHKVPCTCSIACPHRAHAEQDALDTLIDEASHALRAKLRILLSEGYTGWDNPENREALMTLLKQTLEKGNHLETAIMALFLWNLDES
jgi:hypothetical protein